MKILSFNRHESYLNTLAATGHEFDIIIHFGKTHLPWNKTARPVPANINLVHLGPIVKDKLRQGYYDLIICHTLEDLLCFFFQRSVPFIFIAHIALYFHSIPFCIKSYAKKWLLKIFRFVHSLQLVAVSEFKLETWQEKGETIVLAPETIEWDGQRDWSQAIVVGNHIKERGRIFGLDLIKKIQEKIPLAIIGLNPTLPEATAPKDFAEFQKLFSHAGIYVYTMEYPFNDGYNTAMLEAMKLGMAIVSIANPSSPLQHGINGLIASNAEEMITHIQTLQNNPAMAQKLGEGAKQTVQRHFSKQQFIDSWNKVFHKVKTYG